MITLRGTEIKQAITRDALHKIPLVKLPQLSDRWGGVQHGELVDTIGKRLSVNKIKVVDERWHVSGENLGRLDGFMTLNMPDRKAPKGTQFCLGISHSNNGNGSLKFAVGAHVMICSNGMVVGEFVLRRRHTNGINLEESVGDGLDRYIEQSRGVVQMIEGFEARDVDDKTSDKILMRAGREGLLPWSRVGQVDQEFRNPTFDAFKKRNAWSLYNAFTYVLQKCPATHQVTAMNQFREVVATEIVSVN